MTVLKGSGFRLFALVLLLAATPGCGLIFGGDQSVDNKSHDYTVVRLDREKDREWRFLAPGRSSSAQSGAEPTYDDTGDVAFEHRSTGAIISVDSVCHEYRDASLDELTHYLLLGLKTEGPVVTQPAEVDGVNALDSSVQASMNRRTPSSGTPTKAGRPEGETPVRVRAVVLRKNGCTFDLMYIASPEHFTEQLPTFERFLKGFHVH
jgi:hypothetical protein